MTIFAPFLSALNFYIGAILNLCAEKLTYIVWAIVAYLTTLVKIELAVLSLQVKIRRLHT